MTRSKTVRHRERVISIFASYDAVRNVSAVSLGNKLLCFLDKPTTFLKVQGHQARETSYWPYKWTMYFWNKSYFTPHHSRYNLPRLHSLVHSMSSGKAYARAFLAEYTVETARAPTLSESTRRPNWWDLRRLFSDYWGENIIWLTRGVCAKTPIKRNVMLIVSTRISFWTLMLVYTLSFTGLHP